MTTTTPYPLLTIATGTDETTVQVSKSNHDQVTMSIPSDRYLGRTMLEAVAELSQQLQLPPSRFAHIEIIGTSGHPAAVRTSTLVGTLLTWAADATVSVTSDTGKG